MLLLSKQLFETAGVRVDVADEGGEDLPLSIYSSAREEELVFDAEGNAHLRQGALLSLSVGKSSPRATGAQLLLPKLLRSAKSCQWYVLSVMKTEDESKVVIGTTEQHGTKQTSRIPASELCFTVHYSPATQRVMVSLRGFVQFESAWAAWARPYMRWKRLREAEAFCNTIAREASHTV